MANAFAPRLDAHPRFRFHCLPVHCSWMNQAAQWFGIPRRTRVRMANFDHLAGNAAQIVTFIDQWNDFAHPFRWTATSFARLLAKVETALPPAITLPVAA